MGSGGPTKVDFGRIFERAMETWKQNLGLLVAATLIIFAVSIAFNIASNLAVMVADGNEALILMISMSIGFVSFVVQTFLGIGMVRMCLGFARGQRVEIGALFSGGDRFVPVLVASIIASVAVFFGFLLLIVPAILLLLYFWPYYFRLVDDSSVGIIDSFGSGHELAKINVGTTFLCGLVSICIMLLGVLACGIGILFAGPLVNMMWATAYLMMKGEIA